MNKGHGGIHFTSPKIDLSKIKPVDTDPTKMLPEPVKLDASKLKANKLVINDIGSLGLDEIDSMENAASKLIAKISETNTIRMEVTETTDRFIFQTIQPFCNDIAGFEVSKTELAEAMQLLRLKKLGRNKYGGVMFNDDLSTATYLSAQCEKAYQSGFKDGQEDMKEKMKELIFPF